MGNKYSIPGEEIQKLLDNSAKKIDELNLQIDIYISKNHVRRNAKSYYHATNN